MWLSMLDGWQHTKNIIVEIDPNLPLNVKHYHKWNQVYFSSLSCLKTESFRASITAHFSKSSSDVKSIKSLDVCQFPGNYAHLHNPVSFLHSFYAAFDKKTPISYQSCKFATIYFNAIAIQFYIAFLCSALSTIWMQAVFHWLYC